MSNATETLTFDGTTCTIKPAIVHAGEEQGFDVTICDGGRSMTLETVDGGDLVQNFAAMTDPARNRSFDAWMHERFVFVAGLAARRIARNSMAA